MALQGFARILRSLCRKEDLPARIGGEEFLAVLPMTELQDARILGSRICETVRRTDLMGNGHTITVSIGIAQLTAGDTPASLLERADQALYRAKNHGRDQVCA
jgi:diguanylate cyclase (GGDEF)-like protein